MVTTQEDRDPVVETREERALRIARLVIAGHEAGAIRRIALYAVVLIALGLSIYWPPLAVIAAVAVLLLSATDQLL